MTYKSETDFGWCRVVCWAIAAVIAAAIGIKLIAMMPKLLAIAIAVIIFLFLGCALRGVFCTETSVTTDEEKAVPTTSSSSSDAPEITTAPATQEPVAAAPQLYDQAPSDADDLKLIKGVGPKLETLVNNVGVYKFEQIARWSAEDIEFIDSKFEGFNGRIARDGWVDQAKALLAGDQEKTAKRKKK